MFCSLCYSIWDDFELANQIDDLKQSLTQDKEDYLLAITENRGHIAMILIDKAGMY